MNLKKSLKKAVNGLFVLLNIPFLLAYFFAAKAFNQDGVFASFSQFYSLVPGQFGNYLRRNFYRYTMAYCGENVVFGFGALFSHQGIEVGDNVYIGPQCNIGLCKIGEETLIGSGVHILSGKNQHNFSDPNKPLREQGGHFEKISIGSNCWVGNQATIMANIGNRVVVGAAALVVKDAADNKVVLSGNVGVEREPKHG